MPERLSKRHVNMATRIRTALVMVCLLNLSTMWAVTGADDSDDSHTINDNNNNTTSECPPAENIFNCPPGQSFRLDTACTDCIRGKYKEEYGPGACKVCPVDDRGQQSSTFDAGASNKSMCLFRPYIKSCSPRYGPVAGGTRVTIEVGYLTNREAAYVNVAGLRPRPPTVDRTETAVVTLTEPALEPTQGSIIMQLFDDYNEYTIVSPEEYSYLPNPDIDTVDDMKTIISGGLVLSVWGQNLFSVHSPRLMVHRIYFGNSTIFYTNCHRDNSTLMKCVTPDLKSGLDMEDLIAQYEMENNDDNNDDNDNNSVSLRERRTPDEQQPASLNGEDLDFFLGFEMDGVEEYRNFSSLPVYLDPDFQRFEEEDSMKTFYSDDEYLDIKGVRLNHGVRESDIVVKIGVEECPVTFLASNLLTCQPPKSQPKSGPEGSGPKGTPMVVVYIGESLSFVIGFLEYRSRIPLGYPENMAAYGEKFVLIMSVSMVVLLWGVIAWALGAWYACNSYTQGNDNVVKEGGEEDEESVENDYRAESERYLSPVENGQISSMNTIDEISMDTAYATVSEYAYAELSDIPDAVALLNVLRKDGVKDLCLDNKRLTLLQCIGEGNFGCVYKGALTDDTFQNPQDVAVKTLQASLTYSEEELTAFVEEAIILKGFNHRNIVQLFGITIEGLKPHVVLEYMDKSDLRSHVSDKTVSLTKGDLLGYGLQVAEGMMYLSNSGFIHRDLAARNCMINSSSEVKIADFGLSRDLHKKDYYLMREMQEKPMPIKWMAKESLNSAKFSVKSDVWSFGILLWELLMRGVTPYPDVDNFDVREYINEGRRLDRPNGTLDEVWVLMTDCWLDEPGERPSFEHLSRSLGDVLEYNYALLSKNDYMDLY